MQDGEDGCESLLPPQRVRQRQEPVDDVLEVLQVGSFPALVSEVLLDLTLKRGHLFPVLLLLNQDLLLEVVNLHFQLVLLLPQGHDVHLLASQLLRVQDEGGLTGGGEVKSLGENL